MAGNPKKKEGCGGGGEEERDVYISAVFVDIRYALSYIT